MDDRAGSDATSEERWSRSQDYYAFATLQVPIDDLLGNRRRPLVPPRIDADEVRLARNDEQEEDLDIVSPNASSERAERDEPNAGERPGALSLSEDSHDPDESTPEDEQSIEPPRPSPALVRAVVREIAERVGTPLRGAELRLKSLVRRSRWSGLSPELRLRGVLGFDRTTSTEETVGIYPGDTTVRGARDSLAEVRLTFRLDRLVLGDGEDSLERQRIELEEERRELVEEALELFSTWRLAQAKSEDPSLPPDESLEALVDAESAALQLHLMTGGWFAGTESIDEVARRMPDLFSGGHNR